MSTSVNVNFSLSVWSDGIKRPDVKQPPINQNARREVYRLASFEECKGLQNLAVRLALSGYYYIGPGDLVMCFSCGTIVEKFDTKDNPREPKWHHPTCKFLLGKDSGNISLMKLPSAKEPTPTRKSLPSLNQHEQTTNKQGIITSHLSSYSSPMYQETGRGSTSSQLVRYSSHEDMTDTRDGNIQGYLKFDLPGDRLTPTHINIRKQSAVSSCEDIQIQIGMSASIPGPSGLPRGVTHVKQALPVEPISSPGALHSFFKTVSFSEQSSGQARSMPHVSSKTDESSINKLQISSLVSKSTLTGVAPEISPDPSLKQPPYNMQLTPTYPPPHAESSPSSLMLSFLGQTEAITTTVTNPSVYSVPSSPARGFYPIKPPVQSKPQSHGQPTKLKQYAPSAFKAKTSVLAPSALRHVTPQYKPSMNLPTSKETGLLAQITKPSKIVEVGSQTKHYSNVEIPSSAPASLQLFEGPTELFQSAAISTTDTLSLPITQKTPVLRKIFTGPHQQPESSLPSQDELLEEFDPCKSIEILPEHRTHEPPKYTPQLDVGNYIVEPFKSLVVEQFPCLNPVHSEYETVIKRIETFPPGFPVYESRGTITDVAEAGFYSIGSFDEVCCWYCGMEAVNWCKEVDPWVKHSLDSPSCEYLLRNRGDDFVKTVLKDPHVKNVNQIRRRISTQITSPVSQPTLSSEEFGALLAEHLQSEVTMQLVMMGFEKKTLIQLTKERIRNAGSGFENIEEALDGLERFDQDLIDWDSDNDGDLLPDPPALEYEPEPEPQDLPQINPSSLQEEPRRSQLSEVEEHDIRRELKKLKDEKRCKVCLDRDSCMIFVPCGHICACAECTSSLRRCPICRRYIERSYRTYSS